MSVGIVTAIGDPRWESALTAELCRPGSGLVVVRRCLDVAALLTAAADGVARAVVLSADLRQLNGDAVARLHASDIAVIGLVAPGDMAGEQRLQQLGVANVVHSDATADVVTAAVLDAIVHCDEDRPVSESDRAVVPDPVDAVAGPTGTGRVVAVWGPTGAPGRSTVSVNLAAELVDLGHSVMLVDADSYGGVLGQLLGVPEDAPGVAGACRQATAGTLEVAGLAAIALEVIPALRLLPGISRPERWLELRPDALTTVIALARSLASFIVVDCGFCLEPDDPLAPDAPVPHRNSATVAVLAAADLVVGVAAADPIGLARYVRAVPRCLALAGNAPLITVANRLRRDVVGPGEPRRQVVAALDRYADLTDVHVVPDDREALDRAVVAGRVLAEVAPKSAARGALRDLAMRVAGRRSAGRSRRH